MPYYFEFQTNNNKEICFLSIDGIFTYRNKIHPKESIMIYIWKDSFCDSSTKIDRALYHLLLSDQSPKVLFRLNKVLQNNNETLI